MFLIQYAYIQAYIYMCVYVCTCKARWSGCVHTHAQRGTERNNEIERERESDKERERDSVRERER